MHTNIDIIILSHGATDELRTLTTQAIQSLLISEDPSIIQFNILVIESNKMLAPHQYPNSTTIYPKEKFGYNKYLNIGLAATKNPYVCLCNNDLIFHKRWASEIVHAMNADPLLLSATPYCSTYHAGCGIQKNSGNVDAYMGVMAGWCIFVKRSIFDIIGKFDENFIFWYSDNDYCQNLIENNLKSKLITSSFVTHLGSQSLNTLSQAEFFKLTRFPLLYYNYKWHHHSKIKYIIDFLILKIKGLLK